jgi:type IV pilus assembly protein PilP
MGTAFVLNRSFVNGLCAIAMVLLVSGCFRSISSTPGDAPNLEDDGSGLRPDKVRRKQLLEQFPLDALDMVGTLGRGSGTVALVMAPDKVTYRVRPGAYMGQNDGRVTAVTEERIDLVELVPDGAGGWLERPASVALEDQ